MGPVVVHKLGQSFLQLLLGRALGGKPLHQLGDAVAHLGLVGLHGVGGPAPLGAHPVSGVGQVVNGVEEGSV